VKRADRVRVTVWVAVPPAAAFEVFTRDVNLWWRRGPRFRFSGREDGEMRFEGGAGGRLVQAFGDGGEPFVVGEVLAWEPGARLAFGWRAENFAAGERTEVEVRFEALGEGTRVSLEHRGFAGLRPDHPVRHGETDRAFNERMALWWGDLLSSLREQAAEPGGWRRGGAL
jgi:uncharacterized protein YndB with AHSA1/START domain